MWFRIAGLLVPLALLAGCTTEQPAEVLPPLPSVPAPAPTPSDKSAPARPQPSDDLATGTVQHVIRTDGLQVLVNYQTTKPAAPWTAGGEKPLRVEVRVVQPAKKVYLTRATLRFTVDDGTGAVPGPDPIVDPALNVSPGYLVTKPYRYVQAFALPAVDPSTIDVGIAIKLELVSLVDVKAKDYTKQTVTDTITTAVER